MPQTEHVTVFEEIKTDKMAPVLAYGQRWSSNSLWCRSESRGLTCRDDQTGYGFVLSRERQRILGPSKLTFISDSWEANGSRAEHPRQIVVTADGSVAYSDLIWTGWGSDRAVGRGRAGVNDCDPSCAGGTTQFEPVTVIASDPGLCNGMKYYFTIRVRRPSGAEDSAKVTPGGYCTPHWKHGIPFG